MLVESPVTTQCKPKAAIRLWVAVGMVIVLGFALRITTAMVLPSVHYPDEVFQALEPAHRLAFGPGVTAWEYRTGTRSWVLPGILAGVMRGSAWLGAGSTGYLTGVRIVLCLLSLVPVIFAYKFAGRLLGPTAGILAACICAFWYELIYYAPRPFSEVVAAHVLLPAIYFAVFSESGEARRRLFLAGLFCGLTVMFRLQLAPAVAVIVLYACWKKWRQVGAVLAGIAGPVLLFGGVDWITWSYPFQSTYLNFTVNLVQHKAAYFGTMPWNLYLRQWLIFVGPMLAFAVIGAVAVPRARVLAVVVLAVLIPHSLLAHKEDRFIYPALPVVLTLAALGIWVCAGWLRNRARLKPQWAFALVITLIAGGATYAVGGPRIEWDARVGALRAFQELSLRSDACGVALWEFGWQNSGGYTYLHRNIPIFLPELQTPPLADPEEDPQDAMVERWKEFDTTASAFNYVVTKDPMPANHPEFTLQKCWGDTCLYRRAGACATVPGYSINEVLRIRGE